MSLLTTVAQAMQTVLTEQAEQAARQSGFSRRRSPLGGPVFVQAMTFACLGHAQPTLDHFCQAAAAVGSPVQPQAFDQRFQPPAAECLRLTLAAAVGQVIAAEPLAVGLLARFEAVYIQDSTTIVLPDCLETLWRGKGGSSPNNTRSAVKFQARLDLRSGQLIGPFPEAGRASDQTSVLQMDDLPAGSLRIADLGYFDLEVFARFDRQGAYWLSRWHYGTALYDQQGQRLALLSWLLKQTAAVVDVPVQIGRKQRLPGRLVAMRVPEEVAQQRRGRMLEKARDRGKKVTAERLALCAWTLLLTNVPVALASAEELGVLGRCRWQVELLFKLWKSKGGLATSRSEQPYRVLCEVYAKMVALLVQHWVLLDGCWQQPRRSLTKASAVVRQQALSLASALGERLALVKALEVTVRCLRAGSRIHKSKSDPRTWQLLLKPAHYGVPLS